MTKKILADLGGFLAIGDYFGRQYYLSYCTIGFVPTKVTKKATDPKRVEGRCVESIKTNNQLLFRNTTQQMKDNVCGNVNTHQTTTRRERQGSPFPPFFVGQKNRTEKIQQKTKQKNKMTHDQLNNIILCSIYLHSYSLRPRCVLGIKKVLF